MAAVLRWQIYIKRRFLCLSPCLCAWGPLCQQKWPSSGQERQFKCRAGAEFFKEALKFPEYELLSRSTARLFSPLLFAYGAQIMMGAWALYQYAFVALFSSGLCNLPIEVCLPTNASLTRASPPAWQAPIGQFVCVCVRVF